MSSDGIDESSANAQRRFAEAMQAVAPGCGFLHYSYCVTSPLPWEKLGLSARREAWTPRNIPPGFGLALHARRLSPPPPGGAGSTGSPQRAGAPFETAIAGVGGCKLLEIKLSACFAAGTITPGLDAAIPMDRSSPGSPFSSRTALVFVRRAVRESRKRLRCAANKQREQGEHP